MQTIYRLRPGHLILRVLRLIEKASIGFSHLVLTPNVAFRRLFASRSCDPEKIALVMNAPSPRFSRRTGSSKSPSLSRVTSCLPRAGQNSG